MVAMCANISFFATRVLLLLDDFVVGSLEAAFTFPSCVMSFWHSISRTTSVAPPKRMTIPAQCIAFPCARCSFS